MKIQTRESATALAVVLPILVYFIIFTIVPVVMLFYYSMTDLSLVYGSENFIGLRNFVNIFKYKEYINSFLTTLSFAVLIVLFGTTFGLLLALAINSLPSCKSFYRIIYYLPALLSTAVISKLVNTMLDYNGSINSIIVSLGGEPIVWYDSLFWMYFYIILIVTWKGFGGTALLLMAGLGGISKEVYEAADIDGAKGAVRFFYITVPLLRPMLGYVLILGFIGAFNIFEPVMFISLGQPDDQTKVILYKIYDEAFRNFNQGLASALSVLVLIVVMACTIVNMKISGGNLLKMERPKNAK